MTEASRLGRAQGPPYARRMTTAPTSAPRPRAHLIAGMASVLVSGLLGMTWLWISILTLVSGLSGLLAAGTGMVVLIPWAMAMRWAAAVERRRALAVHGVEVVVPARRLARRSGVVGWLHQLWLDVASGPFWRAALHHHAVMLVGLLLSALFWTVLVSSAALALSLLGLATPPPRLGTAAVVALACALLLLAVGILAVGAVAERGLARVMLPDADDALREEVVELAERRQGAVDAATAERLRIERDLHDGVQPRLVALSMTLGLARSRIASDPERAEQLVAEAHEESKAIMTELRQLARGIHPAVLTDRGLDAALSALAARSTIPVELHVDVPTPAGREAEAVAYFVVAEALTNIAKHSGASRARADVRGDASALRIVVEDDGIGGAQVRRDGVSTGLAGLTDRVRATGGSLEISSARLGADGRGTRLAAVIPHDRKDTPR